MALLDTDRIRLLIPLLDEVRFAALCNDLLIDIAVPHSIPRSCLRLNLNTKESDGGIDAACVDAPSVVPRLIPRPNTDYQFKSGHTPRSVAKIVGEDILGQQRVVEALKNGHAFVYMAGWDRSDKIEDDIIEKLGDAGLPIEADQIVFFGREMLTQQFVASPALVSRYLGVDLVANLVESEQWSRRRTMSNVYISDQALLGRVTELRERIEVPGALVRLVGAAGDGKTRMVLEALRGSDLSGTVLYAGQADAVTPSVIQHLVSTPDVRCTLVVDEVDDAAAFALEDRLHARPSGVRLVLIGLDATGRAQPDTLQVEGLPDELLIALMRSIAAGLTEDVAREIAADCERSPKLAVLIAERIRENPQLVRATVLADRKIQSQLDIYLSIERNADPWRALAGTALLMRLGWSGEFEEESTLLFDLIGLDPIRARQDVQALHDRFGIAPVAGRFRYVSPAILGDHLSAGELQGWTRDHMTTVFGALTPTMAESFVRRARRLSAILENAAVVEEVILGAQGPFRDIADVEKTGTSFVLRHLAAAFPRAALGAIQRIVENATYEELFTATNSRRDLYWALEELLWPAESFELASQLLLRLAVAENETWANNASQTWAETFQMVLGRTAAGWQARLRVVRKAASDADERARILATKAIQAAFKSGSLTRSGNPPRDVPGMPKEEWRPATYGEWSDALVAYLDVLEPLMSDGSPEVKKAAVETLGSIVPGLFHVSDRVVERWRQTVLKLADEDYEVRAEVLKKSGWALDRWSDRLVELGNELPRKDSVDATLESEDREGQREGITHRLTVLREVEEALGGKGDFTTLFRRSATKSYYSRRRGVSLEENEAAVREKLTNLVNAVLAEPGLMEEQWAWLLNESEWRGAERWCEILGGVDRDRVFGEQLERRALQSSRASMCLSLYDLSFAAATKDDDFLDKRIAEFVARGWYTQAVDLLLRARFTAPRLVQLRQLLADQKIPAGALNQFAYGSWGGMPATDAADLLATALEKTDQRAELVPYVDTFLTIYPGAIAAFRESALSVLSAAASARPGTVDSYHWSELAKRFVDSSALVIADLVLHQIAEQQASHDGALIEALQASWNGADKRQLFTDVVAKWLDGDFLGGFWVRSALETIPIEDAGEDFLLTWVRENPKKRAYVLAQIIAPPHSPMTSLQARMLEEFAEEGVGSAFSSAVMSGMFEGSHSEWSRSRLLQARQWASDERAAVRDWAKKLVKSLEEDVRHSEAREAEERLMD